MKMLDLLTGETLPDTLEWIKFGMGAAWAKDGSGFFYSRYPEPPEGEAFQALNTDSTVYFHRIGTDQAADRKVYATPDHPEWGHYVEVSDDGRWLIVTTSEGTDDIYQITIVDL